MQPAEESIFDRSTVSAPSSAPALPKLYRGRPWLTALAAVLTELVVIGGVDNQGVTKTLRDPLNDPSRVVADYSSGAIDAATAFWWRFAPSDGQATHVWAAQFAAIGVLVLLTWLGALAVARGSVTFGRVWIAVWAVVAAVAPVAIMVRNVLVTPTAPGPAQSRIGQSVYGFDAFGPVIVAGLVLGVVTGLITAAVAVSSRRQVAAATPLRSTGEQDEYYDDSFSPRYSSPPVYEPRPWGEPQWERPEQDPQGATTQLPRYAPDDQSAPYTHDDQPTVATPMPDWPASQEPVPSAPPAPEPAATSGPSAQVWRPEGSPEPADEPQRAQQADAAPEPVYGMPPEMRRELQREPDVEATQAIPVQPAEPAPPTGGEPAEQPAGRELADEDELADELAVEEHTQQLPRVTDEPEHPNR
jgi:hypothetical protein